MKVQAFVHRNQIEKAYRELQGSALQYWSFNAEVAKGEGPEPLLKAIWRFLTRPLW